MKFITNLSAKKRITWQDQKHEREDAWDWAEVRWGGVGDFQIFHKALGYRAGGYPLESVTEWIISTLNKFLSLTALAQDVTLQITVHNYCITN